MWLLNGIHAHSIAISIIYLRSELNWNKITSLIPHLQMTAIYNIFITFLLVF